MGLVEDIKAIAKLKGISESELILDKMEAFIREHERHSELEVRIKYSPKLEIVRMSLVCYSEPHSIMLYDRGIVPLKLHREKD